MTLLVVTASHRTATAEVLQTLSLPGVPGRTVLQQVAELPAVHTAVLLRTCNRVELYCAVTDLDSAARAVRRLVRSHTDAAVRDGLRVHRDRDAVRHLFRVTCGLEAMAVGETEVLGQVRVVLRQLQATDAPTTELHQVFQRAVRVARLVHRRTELPGLSRSLIDAALQDAELVLGGLTARAALLVGAGSYARLVARALRKEGIGEVTVANRTPAQALRLAGSIGGRAVGLPAVPTELERADLAVFCTGASGLLLSEDTARTVGQQRSRGSALVVADLSLPRDVAPGVARVPDMHLIDLQAIGAHLTDDHPPGGTAEADALVDSEVDAYLAHRNARSAILGLQMTAQQVVDAELTRLRRRLPEMDATTQSEIARSLERVGRTLLHPQIAELQGTTSAPSPGSDRPAPTTATPLRLGHPGHRDAAGPPLGDGRPAALPPAAAA